MDVPTTSNKEISQSDVYHHLITLQSGEDASRDSEFQYRLSQRIKNLPEEAEYTLVMAGLLPLQEPSNEKAYLERIRSSLEKRSFVDAGKWMRSLQFFYWRELYDKKQQDKKQEDLTNSEMDLSA
jgi:hypothetical protein